jgi:hypothetical protein
MLTDCLGKYRDVQRLTVQYARVLDLIDDEADNLGNGTSYGLENGNSNTADESMDIGE